jgi:copper(I)-binding protein
MKAMTKLISLFLLILSFNVFAVSENNIQIQTPIIRSTPPGMNVTAIFFKIVNNTKEDLKIIKVTGDFAKTFELHKMEMAEGRMQMRPIDFITVGKNSTSELKSGGLHIMVFGVLLPLKRGEVHKFKIILNNKTEIEVSGKVE